MENILLTATLYIIVFGVLCQFVKTKPVKTANATTTSPTIKVVSPASEPTTEPAAIVPPVAPKMPVERAVQATKPTIAALIKEQMQAPTTVINATSLAAIMEDRNATKPAIIPNKTSRNKKPKKSLSGFLREMEALV